MTDYNTYIQIDIYIYIYIYIYIFFFGGGLVTIKIIFNHGTYVSSSSKMARDNVRPISQKFILTSLESSILNNT